VIELPLSLSQATNGVPAEYGKGNRGLAAISRQPVLVVCCCSKEEVESMKEALELSK
jgi:hypothetical protein